MTKVYNKQTEGIHILLLIRNLKCFVTPAFSYKFYRPWTHSQKSIRFLRVTLQTAIVQIGTDNAAIRMIVRTTLNLTFIHFLILT